MRIASFLILVCVVFSAGQKLVFNLDPAHHCCAGETEEAQKNSKSQTQVQTDDLSSEALVVSQQDQLGHLSIFIKELFEKSVSYSNQYLEPKHRPPSSLV